MIADKSALFSELMNNSETIRSFGVERIGVFGSFVRDTANRNSDIDFIVEFRKGEKNYDNMYALHLYLQSLTQRNIEVVTKESLSPYIGPFILQETEYVSFRN
ncbi:MAG: nucleotidyltransferase family protein [Bacteroidota bacterium]